MGKHTIVEGPNEAGFLYLQCKECGFEWATEFADDDCPQCEEERSEGGRG